MSITIKYVEDGESVVVKKLVTNRLKQIFSNLPDEMGRK